MDLQTVLQNSSDPVREIYRMLRGELGKAHPYHTAAASTLDSINLLVSSAHPSVEPSEIAQESWSMAQSWLSNPGRGARIHLTKAIFDSCSADSTHELTNTYKFPYTVCAIVEATHNLSLIVDDCIDGDLVRRNGQTIFGIGGVSAVLAVSRLLINLIFRLIWTLPFSTSIKEKCVNVVVTHAYRIAASIHSELYWESAKEWHFDPRQVGEVTEIYAVKSIGVVEMGVDLMRCLTSLDQTRENWLTAYTRRIGIFLQQVNDIENFSTIKSCGAKNSDRFGDIRKRRLTLLLLRESQYAEHITESMVNRAFRHNRTDRCIADLVTHLIRTGAIAREIVHLTEQKHLLEQDLADSPFLDGDLKLLIRGALNHYFSKLAGYQFALGAP